MAKTKTAAKAKPKAAKAKTDDATPKLSRTNADRSMVGEIVHYFPGEHDSEAGGYVGQDPGKVEPRAAMVTRSLSSDVLNLTVMRDGGPPIFREAVVSKTEYGKRVAAKGEEVKGAEKNTAAFNAAVAAEGKGDREHVSEYKAPSASVPLGYWQAR